MTDGDKYYTFRRVQGRDGEELMVLVWTVSPDEDRWVARSCDFTGHSTTEYIFGDVGKLEVVTPQRAVEWAAGVYGEQYRQSVTEQLQLMGEL